MIATLTTLVAVNATAVCYKLAVALTPLLVRVVGKGNHMKMLYMRQLLKEKALCMLGYNDCVHTVFLHAQGCQRRDITREVSKIDAHRGRFLTSADYIYSALNLPPCAKVEVHGRNKHGEPYRFVFNKESQLFVPLHQNYVDVTPGKSVSGMDATYMGKKRDITSIARRWLHCDVEVEDVLSYIVRDFIDEDENIWEHIAMAEDEDVVVIRVIYSDLSTDIMTSPVKSPSQISRPIHS